MKIHPNEERLAELLRAVGSDQQALIRHLLRCEPCRERLHRLALSGEGDAGRPGALDYGQAFAAASRRVRSQASSLAGERRDAAVLFVELAAAPAGSRQDLLRAERFQTWGFFELLVDRAQERSVEDPAWAEELASLAIELSAFLSPLHYRRELVEDLRARAWAYLGTARRLASDLAGAAAAFVAAGEHLRRGTGDPIERAIVLDRRASLERDLRRFGAARASLERAVGIFLRNGESHRAGRSLVNLSLVHSYAGEAEQSIETLSWALELIDPKQDPRTLLCARHNLAGYLAEAGRYEDALGLYQEALPLYGEFPDAWTENRRQWLLGRIEHGLGRPGAGEQFLRAARDGFLAEGIPYDTALVSLDLALLYAEQGRTAELKELAAGMVPIFASRHIHREALAALAFLQQAIDAETATLDIVTRVADYLRRAQHDPELRWDGASQE